MLTPHIGGATYDTEANHTMLIVDGLGQPARRRHAVEPREPGGPEVSDVSASRVSRLATERLPNVEQCGPAPSTESGKA